MKALSPSFADALQGPVTHLCRCLKVTTLSGTVYALTDLDQDVTVGGVVYRADVGFSASDIQVTDGTAQSSVDVTILLQDDFITREMLVSGAFDNAAAAVQIVEWSTLDIVTYYAGKLRHITFNDKLSADLEIASILDPNLQVCFSLYSYTCRVDLGSPPCGVPIAATAKNFTVTDVTDRYLIHTDLTDADNYWIDGLVSITTGKNANVSRETSGYNQTNGSILLKQAAPFGFIVGDTGTVYRGCNKTPGDCHDKWNNMPNYRGEPTGIPKVPPSSLSSPPPTTVTTPPTGGGGGGGGSTGVPIATPAQRKVLAAYAGGGAAISVSPQALRQCIANGWISNDGNSTTITPLGLQVLNNTPATGAG